MADTLPESDPNREPLQEVILAAERASLLTGQLLAYAGKGRVETRRIHLSELVREVGGLIETATPKSVEIRYELMPDVPAVEVDSAQIQQVVMNLVINAAARFWLRPGYRRWTRITWPPLRMAFDIPPGTYVALDVQDNGCGMDEATPARIFDPFHDEVPWAGSGTVGRPGHCPQS